MTGPEHYAEAQLLLETGCEYGCPHSGCEHEAAHLARAQAHATLAVAAAIGLGMAATEPADLDVAAWHQIAGTRLPSETAP